MAAIQIKSDSVHHKILMRLCAAPKAVRGVSEVMLVRSYGDPRAIEELAQARLIRKRGWHDGPGGVWIPTAAGADLCEKLTAR